MDDSKYKFDVLSVGEMKAKYYSPQEVPPQIRLDAEKLPEPLRILVPLAEKWGISDDILRVDAARSSPIEIKELKVQDLEKLESMLASLNLPIGQ